MTGRFPRIKHTFLCWPNEIAVTLVTLEGDVWPNRWDEKAGPGTGCGVRSQLPTHLARSTFPQPGYVLKAQEVKEAGRRSSLKP